MNSGQPTGTAPPSVQQHSPSTAPAAGQDSVYFMSFIARCLFRASFYTSTPRSEIARPSRPDIVPVFASPHRQKDSPLMDPATGIGLAASLIQITVFVKDVISTSQQIVRSSEGAKRENLEIEDVSKRLQELLRNLRQDQSTANASTQGLKEVCEGCDGLLTELLDSLGKLKIEPGRKRTTLQTVPQALAVLWNAKKIKELEARVDRYRTQAILELVISSREGQYESTVTLIQKSDELRTDLQRYMNESSTWKSDILASMNEQNQRTLSLDDVTTIRSMLARGSMSTDDNNCLRKILLQLKFDRMQDRDGTIDPAYKKTFDWVYSLPESVLADQNAAVPPMRWDNFVQWLESDVKIYWITGKPGSGKSTLMKYLYENTQTHDYLREWASPQPVITASFFFWNAGTDLQKSQLGLVQALVYQLLQRLPQHVSGALHERWERFNLLGTDQREFSSLELIQALRHLVADSSYRFALFIDGLDEVDGNHRELVDFLIEMSQHPNVKLCLSSRHWNLFSDAFKTCPRLKMENLTRNDVLQYITGKFAEEPRFQELQKLCVDDCNSLVREICEKAVGVFLWVRLVVRDLVQAMQDGDSISELNKKLMDLPSDLENLYEKMLKQVNPSHVAQMSAIFQLRRASRPIDNTLVHYYVCLTNNHAKSIETALEADQAPLPIEELRSVQDHVTRLLSSRCRGLLEHQPDSYVALRLGDSDLEKSPKIDEARLGLSLFTKIDYMHRTVQDYLQKPSVWEKILLANKEFDAEQVHLAAGLLQLKKLRAPGVSCGGPISVADHFSFIIDRMFAHFINADRSPVATRVKALDELNQCAFELFRQQSGGEKSSKTWLQLMAQEGSNWIFVVTRPFYNRPNLPLKVHPRPEHFEELCCLYEFDWYFQHKLKEQPQLATCHGMILAASTAAKYSLVKTLKTVLEGGVDPNLLVEGDSVWIALLRFLVVLTDLDTSAGFWDFNLRLCQNLATLLEYGADRTVVCNGDSALGIVQKWVDWAAKENQISKKDVAGVIKTLTPEPESRLRLASMRNKFQRWKKVKESKD